MASSPPAATKQHPGERLAGFFDNFFKTLISIATLGASLTFAKIVQTPVEPWVDHKYSKVEIQFFLSVSWLFFLLVLGTTSFAACALSLWREQAVELFGLVDTYDRRSVMWYATAVTTVLLGQLFVAFIFMGLVIVGYEGGVGWTAIAFTACAGATGLACIVWQSPIGSPPPKGVDTHHAPPYTGVDDGRYGSYASGSLDGVPRPHDGYTGGFVEERMEGSIFEEPAGDDYRYEEDIGTPSKQRRNQSNASYVDQSRRPSPMMPRPTFAVVPPYTEDLRRMRAIKTSDDYEKYSQF